MAATPLTEPVPSPEGVTSFWRWLDDDYIAQGKLSWLAVIEVLVAFYIYYFWLIPNTLWPWVTVLSFLTVPILLLRSKSSTDRGVQMLKDAMAERELTKTRLNLYLIPYMIGIALFFLLAYLLTKNILQIHIFLIVTGFICFLYFLAIKYLFDITSGSAANMTRIAAKISRVAAKSGASFEAVAAAAAKAGDLGKDGRQAALLATFMWIPQYIISLFLRGLWIRISATCTWPHFKAGIASFSHNLYETVLVSDFRHAPALLPHAGEVSSWFNVATIPKRTHDVVSLHLRPILIAAIFIVATIYRWNIKANALIWTPVAIGFQPNFWLPDPEAPLSSPESKRKHSARFANAIALGLLGLICLYFLGFVGLSGWVAFQKNQLSAETAQALPEILKTIYSFLPLLPFGFRLLLVTFFLLSAAMLLWVSYCMLSDYPQQLNDTEAYTNMKPQVKRGFDVAAERIARWRKITQMMAIFVTYALFIKFAVAQWPTIWGEVIGKQFIDLL